ncbi:MAG: RNA polymerase sigma factor [Muribaculaceae bacterium]|nr:RNA polymerase sigma factor [Muribaculaceae bacterium]
MFKKNKHDIISETIEKNLNYYVRFAYYRIGNREEAEDLVYDAILKFLERDTSNINPDSVRLYLFRIIYNLCVDRKRSVKNDTILIDNVEMEDREENILDLEDADRINECLEKLPLRESEVIWMNVIDNLSFVDISTILSISQSTAKSRYKSGMEKLRKLFSNKKMS